MKKRMLRTKEYSERKELEKMNVEIILGETFINSVGNNSGVFYGDNILYGWQTGSKSNTAINRVNGDKNFIASRLNYLNDSDIIDMMSKTEERE